MYKKIKTFNQESRLGTIALLIFGAIIILGTIFILNSIFGGLFDSENSSTFSTTTPSKIQENTDLPGDSNTITHSPVETENTAISLTQTVTPTPTPTLTPTLTPNPTPGNIANDKYSRFVATVYGEAKVDANVPLRIRGHIVADGKELIIIMNRTSRSEDELRRVQEVNTLVTSGFAQAVFHYDNGKIDGNIPNKLRIAEVNNTGTTPKTLYVNTSAARDYYLNNVSEPEFTNQYWDSERNMTTEEQKFVRKIDINAGNGTLYNESVSSK